MTGPSAERFSAYGLDSFRLAQRLLGATLVRVIDGQRCAGVIVETEAYLGPPDRAAHTFGGRRTARNRSMWLGGGHAYVYFTYGMHFCFNVVAGPPDTGTAVLIRALRPTEGLDAMAARRGRSDVRLLCSGPARLTQALAIDRALDGEDLRTSERLFLQDAVPLPADEIGCSPRIGVERSGVWAKRLLRFVARPQAEWASRPGPLQPVRQALPGAPQA